jgi:Fe-Mn family superoxide dismutase
MEYPIAPIFCRPWTLNNMSPRLIESHYEYNYGGAVSRLNVIRKELETLDPVTTAADTYSRLKRDEITALNATLLHELYFASLGGDGRNVPEQMTSALTRDFGSVERWRQEFVALAGSLAGGCGWVLLSWLPRDSRLINHLGADHNQCVPGAFPILALDMYEHAYHIEFGANAAGYIAGFMRNIDWAAVQERYGDAVKVPAPRRLVQPQFADVPSITDEEVKAMLASGTPVQLLDTRPKHYSTRSQDIVEGAVWRDPERVDEWIGEISKSEPVVTFCVYGFHIGCETAAILRKAGFDARYMAGVHYAWNATKGPVRLFE